jgi:xanthine dehydrogenase accessory factor
VVLATYLETGAQEVLAADAEDEAVKRALDRDIAFTIDTELGPRFFQPFNPKLRLLIVGAVHIAQPLCTMAGLAGYEVTVIDPRGAFAKAARFPGTEVSEDWPDEGLEAANLDARCAVVTLSHDPKIDDPALHVALKSSAFYVGSLGSKRTHAARLERLKAAGFDSEACARIHGPVGLSIGAQSPAEIAISVLAQMTERLRRP